MLFGEDKRLTWMDWWISLFASEEMTSRDANQKKSDQTQNEKPKMSTQKAKFELFSRLGALGFTFDEAVGNETQTTGRNIQQVHVFRASVEGWIYKGELSSDGATTFGELEPGDKASFSFPDEDWECGLMEPAEEFFNQPG